MPEAHPNLVVVIEVYLFVVELKQARVILKAISKVGQIALVKVVVLDRSNEVEGALKDQKRAARLLLLDLWVQIEISKGAFKLLCQYATHFRASLILHEGILVVDRAHREEPIRHLRNYNVLDRRLGCRLFG